MLGASVQQIMGFPAGTGFAPYASPTLFIGGMDSPYISADSHAAIRRHFPAATITMVEDAGHFVHVDQPQRVADLIGSFLEP